MAKVKWAVASRARRKKLLKRAKGFRGARRLHILKVKETVLRAKAYATRDRKARKRQYRSLWIVRINAACRERGLTYGRLVNLLKKKGVALDRKALAWLAMNDSAGFDAVVATVRG